MKEKIKASADYVQQQGIGPVSVGIILGTGLGNLVESVTILKEISYADIPHFPIPTVEFHQGKLIYGELSGKKVLLFQGRFHLYEGYDFFEITYPVRLLEALGGTTLFLSNAAGGINLSYKKGELMLLEDHINLQGGSPLALKNIASLGERFVDMSAPYHLELNNKAMAIAAEQDLPLHRGVYAAVVGPQLETRAEYRYLKIIGADAVGMSTVPEVIVANQLKIKTLAISIITDECDPDHLKPVDIPEIIAMAAKGEQHLIKIIKALLESF